MITFDAHFDGERLCPEHPVSLPTNVRLRVTVNEESVVGANELKVDGSPAVEIEAPTKKGAIGWLAQIEQQHGLLDGPADWSAELDHYLYGTPKRGT